MTRPYDLPSMTALGCFEAAARNLGFKAAASELNVTPAAVSHQIKALETDLGQPLFRRQHRGVDLTETGAYLFVALQRGFEGISDAVTDIRGRSEDEDVVIQATTAMSAFWLTPQISRFWRSHPDIGVSQIVSDAPPAGGRADLSIHYGEIPCNGGACRHLFRDNILALGTPDYAAQQGIGGLDDLLNAPLIHVTAEDRHWTGWADWFAATGHGTPCGRRLAVNNYMIALQMAQDSLGAVLGWDGLVRPLLARGALVELVPRRVPSPYGFYLRVHSGASDKARLFGDWLVASQQPDDRKR
jgi:DNA-binding transcriptional LysR family regulator